MNEFSRAKLTGRVIGILIMLVTVYFLFLWLIGTGIGRALNGTPSSSFSYIPFFLFLLLFGIGLLTFLGTFYLTKKGLLNVYFLFCLFNALGWIIVFFISFGAINKNFEYLLLTIGILYLYLGYLIRKEDK